MMNKIRDMVARWQISGMRKRMQPAQFSFPADLLSPKHVLVCLPGNLRELTLVKSLLPAVNTLFKSADLTLLSVPGVKVADMFPRKGVQILMPTADQLTWSGLPKKSFLTSLIDYKYDMILDLNLDRSFFTSAILLNFPSAVRVGRGNHLGIPYYNLEIKTRYLRDERNIYRSLLETLGSIMKRPVDTAGASQVRH
ncbi:MAG: hypothetical protein RBT76_05355 [candidate division Zixibacteria bacterium]|jgi:hypothetical protein|nr:hypothetical protein [candidate division Zixibacteria bacterium]